jgi:hypothetical protein
MVQIAAIADLHLDKLDKLFGEDIANTMILTEFDLALQWCYDHHIKWVVQLGDVAEHTRLSYTAHKGLLRLCKKWDTKLNLFFIRGNHDWAEEGVHSLELMETLGDLGTYKTIKFIHDAEQIDFDGITCNLLSYPNTKPLPSNKQPLNFGHFEVAGSLRDNGRKIKEGFEPDPRHRYVLGHLHTPHDVGKAHFVGTLFQTNFGERLPKSFTVIDCDYDGRTLDVNYRRVKWHPAFELVNAVIETSDDWSQLKSGSKYWYKLFISEDVVVPSDIGVRFNIVNTQAWGTQHELELLQTADLLSLDGDSAPDLDPDFELVTWLQKKHGIDAVEAKHILSFRNTLLEQR